MKISEKVLTSISLLGALARSARIAKHDNERSQRLYILQRKALKRALIQSDLFDELSSREYIASLTDFEVWHLLAILDEPKGRSISYRPRRRGGPTMTQPLRRSS